MNEPDFWKDQEEAKKLSQKLKFIKDKVSSWENLKREAEEIFELSEVADEEKMIDEIKIKAEELEKIYKEVSVKTSTTQKSDVVIITGLRASQTTKPVSSGTPKPSSSASASASPKTTPTPTSTP